VNSETPPNRRNSSRVKLALLTLFVLPILISLGVWQLNRAAEKEALDQQYHTQQQLPPVALDAEILAQLSDFRRIVAEGKFDGDHTWLLDNKQRGGRVGFEVISPFQLSDGTWLLVNRGWIAGTGQRDQLPAIPQLSGTQTLFGQIVSLSHHPLLDASAQTDEWPRIIMALDTWAMSAQLERPLANRIVQLDEASPGALTTDWQPIPLSATKHRGYAFQWFAMALALCIWFVVVNTNLLHTWRSSRQK
jgi:surfeit locus 1 family protein